ncbi:urease accessory protein UreF [Roseibacillus persicicus]|uniref:urease accessory protein UreF n=1 Tax=Roseibacillus persicicus TaxID=454148 RepID=UPI00280EC437|nr:urease accessory UreF family protein [Roseibacillus persicicus]MDQ8191552.1 urease accessory UreF family protein [Roseibacillus persicicus]
MSTTKPDTSWLGLVLPFADTAAPVGGYAHSYGLEGLVQDGAVRTLEEFCLFLRRDVWASLQKVDLPLMELTYAAAECEDWREVRALDELAWALRPTRQLREAAGKVGRQQWRLFQRTWGKDAEEPDCFAGYQAPVVAGVVFSARGVPCEGGVRILAYQTYSALLQSALKLLPVGPMAVQELLHEMMLLLENREQHSRPVRKEDLGIFNPLWDIAASRHERAEARLFLS